MDSNFSIILQTGLELLLYVGIGILLMMLGYWLVDLAIPLDFPEEIKNNNKAVAWLSAGIYIGLGLIIKSSVQSFNISGIKLNLIEGVTDTVIYSIIGILLFIVAYYLVDIIQRRYKFNEELKNKNESIGIMLFGIFIGVALIISGVIL